MSDLTDDTIQKIRTMVVEATDDMRQDLQVIKHVQGDHTQTLGRHTPLLENHTQSLDLIRHAQGSQSIMLRSLATDVSQIKYALRAQGVFYEDLEDRFTVLAENVSENLTIRQQVSDHETRLLHIETTQDAPSRPHRIID